MDIEINGKKFLLKELLYLDVVELQDIKDKRKNAEKLLELSGLTQEQIKNLNIDEGAKIMEKINELNGFTGFRGTALSEKSS